MDNEVLIEYLNGNLTSEEAKKVEAWLRASPDNARRLGRIRKVWEVGRVEPEGVDVDRAWERVRSAIRPEARIKRMRWLRVAAAVAILVIGGLTWMKLYSTSMEEVRNLSGEGPMEVALPDGTDVWLNRESAVRFPRRFARAERRVELEGEAYFEVTRREDQPFRIETGSTVTEVLGTSFSIMAYPDSLRSWIQVYSGKVSFASLTAADDRVILEKDQGAVFVKTAEELFVREGAGINALAWKTMVFQFDDVPLPKVASILSRAYDTDIKLVRPALANCRLNASYEEEELDVILQSIALVFDLEIDREGNTIRLDGTGCATNNK